jgi:hypothetical protein
MGLGLLGTVHITRALFLFLRLCFDYHKTTSLHLSVFQVSGHLAMETLWKGREARMVMP